MSRSPCCHDCTDFDEATIEDKGCCTPMPVRRDCEAPTVPVPECNDTEATAVFNPETETFQILARIFDENCEPVLDENSLPVTGYVN